MVEVLQGFEQLCKDFPEEDLSDWSAVVEEGVAK